MDLARTSSLHEGNIIGQQIGKSTFKDISKSISDHESLYSAFGRFYLRSREEDKKLSTKEVERLVEKKKNYVYSWGSKVSEIPISAANVPSLRSFIKKGKEAGRIDFAYDTAKNVLNKLNLIKGNNLLNAGRSLFVKNNGLEVRAAVFATNEKVTFLDIQSFKGTLFDLINQCEAYVKEHINWRADIIEFKRVETPEVPIKAVREAIVNSLCHRDFDNPAGNELAIYKNRIEIYNPGQFPFDYSPDDFIKGREKSIPRNPLIADTFYITKDIERWGSGLKRITDECKERGIKVTFEKIKSGFLVTFYRPETVIPGMLGKGEQKSWVKSSQKSSQKIFELIQQNNYITIRELSKILEISGRAIIKNINILKKSGKLKRIGPDKGGHWEIIIR